MFNQKEQKFKSNNASDRLLGETPVWLALLKLGSTALILSFLTSFFLFITQIMIADFTPKTAAYSFYNLFIYHQEIFSALTSTKLSKNLVFAIANSTGLGVFTTASVVRSSISLITGELFLVATFPSICISGSTIYYAKELGKGNVLKAKQVWQDSVVCVCLVSLFGLILMIILNPILTPTQAVKTNLSQQKIDELWSESQTHLKNIHATANYLNNNVLSIYVQNNNYYLSVLHNNQATFLNITNTNILQVNQFVTLSSNDLVKINVNLRQLLPVWQHYFNVVRNYSVSWAEMFIYIMSVSLIVQCFAGMIVGLVRTDGEIKWTTFVTVVSVLVCVLFNYVLIYCAQLGLTGSAIGCLISIFIELVCYTLILQFHKLSKLKLQDLKGTQFNKKEIYKIINHGINKFIDGVGKMALFIVLTNQLTYISNKLLPTSGSEYFIAVMGAVAPFVSLFITTMSGETKNILEMFSYNYVKHNQKRFIESYWWTFIYGLIVGTIIFLLFGVCVPIKVGLLELFHINALSPNNELASSMKLMLIWMTEIPCLAFMLDGTIIFLIFNNLKIAYLNAALRSSLVSIPFIFIFSTIALHYSAFFGVSIIAYKNNTMWFFMDVGPCYTATYCLIIFIISLVGLNKQVHLNKIIFQQLNKIKIITNNLTPIKK